MNPTVAIIIAAATGLVCLLGLVLYILVAVRRLQLSFGKLGYMVREDAKKYFDDASGKLIDTNQEFKEQYKQIITEGTKAALVDSGKTMELAIAEAQKEASRVLLEAQTNAQRIIAASREQSKKYFYRALNDSVQAIDWTMEQYIGDNFRQSDHEEIIKKLLEAYIRERQ